METPAGKCSARVRVQKTPVNVANGRAPRGSSSREKASAKSKGRRTSSSGGKQKKRRVAAAAAAEAAGEKPAAATFARRKRKRAGLKFEIAAADALGIPADERTYALKSGKANLTACASKGRESAAASAVRDIIITTRHNNKHNNVPGSGQCSLLAYCSASQQPCLCHGPS